MQTVEDLTPEDIHEELSQPFIAEKTVFKIFGGVFGYSYYYCHKFYKGMRVSFDDYRKVKNLADPGSRIVPKRFFDEYIRDQLGYQPGEFEKSIAMRMAKKGKGAKRK